MISFIAIGQRNEKSKEIKLITNQIDSLEAQIESMNDTVSVTLDSLVHGLNSNTESQKRQDEKIGYLINTSNNPSFSLNKDLIYPFILSMLSALLFWLVFSVWPEQRRRNKIRPKLELDIYHIYMDLFALVDTIMSTNRHSPSSYQHKIKGQNLTKEELNLGLQNKCLNETYMFDDKIKAIQLPIGPSLKGKSEKIDREIDRLFDFSENLNPEEILLLESILKKLQFYSYTGSAESEIGGVKLYPVNPSIAYMTDNLFELYKLFGQLEQLVYKTKLRNRDVSIQMIQFLFSAKEYSKCIRNAKRLIKAYPSDSNFLRLYIVRSLFTKGQRKDAYAELLRLIEGKPDLVSSRGFLKELLNDEKANEILLTKYADEELGKVKQVLTTESEMNRHFEENAAKLKQYFIEKSQANSKKAKTD